MLLGRLHKLESAERDWFHLIRDCERLKKKYELRKQLQFHSASSAVPPPSPFAQHFQHHHPPRESSWAGNAPRSEITSCLEASTSSTAKNVPGSEATPSPFAQHFQHHHPPRESSWAKETPRSEIASCLEALTSSTSTSVPRSEVTSRREASTSWTPPSRVHAPVGRPEGAFLSRQHKPVSPSPMPFQRGDNPRKVGTSSTGLFATINYGALPSLGLRSRRVSAGPPTTRTSGRNTSAKALASTRSSTVSTTVAAPTPVLVGESKPSTDCLQLVPYSGRGHTLTDSNLKPAHSGAAQGPSRSLATKRVPAHSGAAQGPSRSLATKRVPAHSGAAQGSSRSLATKRVPVHSGAAQGSSMSLAIKHAPTTVVKVHRWTIVERLLPSGSTEVTRQCEQWTSKG